MLFYVLVNLEIRNISSSDRDFIIKTLDQNWTRVSDVGTTWQMEYGYKPTSSKVDFDIRNYLARMKNLAEHASDIYYNFMIGEFEAFTGKV